jgi:hypothetical protein
MAALMMSTCPTAQDQENFVRTSKFFSFYLELHKNKFKILIRTSKFKFSFRGLQWFLRILKNRQRVIPTTHMPLKDQAISCDLLKI